MKGAKMKERKTRAIRKTSRRNRVVSASPPFFNLSFGLAAELAMAGGFRLGARRGQAPRTRFPLRPPPDYSRAAQRRNETMADPWSTLKQPDSPTIKSLFEADPER